MSVFNDFLTSLDLDPARCGSTLVMSPEKAVKHRACDECRARKLACSKDPDGCGRCKRENLICHYSEQKPMGRPRKRQFIETLQDDPVQMSKDASEWDSAAHATHLAISEDSLEDADHDKSAPYYTNINSQAAVGLPPEETRSGRVSVLEKERKVWHFGDSEIVAGPPIDYGNLHIGNLDLGPSPDHLAHAFSDGSPASNSTNSPQQSVSEGPCSCLASMYLALSSLQQLPTDIVLALKTVRSAAATAAYSIWCPKCGSIVLENPNPPIEAFQNTMLLGTLIPIIANSYHKLLSMIDKETSDALEAQQTKLFQFHDYGGLCGSQETIEQAMVCMEKEMFFNAVEMPPEQWRSTVRALLRVDIYGHQMGSYKRKGLKDLISEMETRQQARHHMIDAHLTSGSYESMGTECNLGGQMHGCLQILHMAKAAIDRLVIA